MLDLAKYYASFSVVRYVRGLTKRCGIRVVMKSALTNARVPSLSKHVVFEERR